MNGLRLFSFMQSPNCHFERAWQGYAEVRGETLYDLYSRLCIFYKFSHYRLPAAGRFEMTLAVVVLNLLLKTQYSKLPCQNKQ